MASKVFMADMKASSGSESLVKKLRSQNQNVLNVCSVLNTVR